MDHEPVLIMDLSFLKTKRELKFKLSVAVTSVAPKFSHFGKDPKVQNILSEYLDTALNG